MVRAANAKRGGGTGRQRRSRNVGVARGHQFDVVGWKVVVFELGVAAEQVDLERRRSCWGKLEFRSRATDHAGSGEPSAS
jgi:hypothetical protein